MTRFMFDSTDPGAIPADGWQLLAGYVNGNWPSYWGLRQRFPNATIISIAVNVSVDAKCLDVENGDATPEQAPAWVARQRAHGDPFPWVYCSEGSWAAVQQAFHDQGVPEPLYWVAAYPGEGAVVPVGAIAHQYGDLGPNGQNIDVSVVADYVPGLDPSATTGVPVGVIVTNTANGSVWLLAPGFTKHVPYPGNDVDILFELGAKNAGFQDPLHIVEFCEKLGAPLPAAA